MLWVVRVGYNEGIPDPIGKNVKKDIRDLNIDGVKQVKSMPTYFIKGNISEEEIKKISTELLADSISQHFQYFKSEKTVKANENGWVVEVSFKPGVTDAVGDSVKDGIKVLNIDGVESVKTGMTYVIFGDIQEEDIEIICRKCLANSLIQNFKYEKVVECK